VSLSFFPSERMTVDLDNTIKLVVVDALGLHVYRDDQQLERVLAQECEPAAASVHRTL
jgi:Holliday junction resolvase RusA-like endonuclease